MIRPITVAVALLLTFAAYSARSAADEAPSSAALEEARKHYRRGIDFYNDKSYVAALAEFRRAYETAPNPSVLYNIAQLQFLLQDYAASLATFERYLREGVATIAPERQRDVEREVARLRDRVAYVEVTSNVAEADVLFGDAVVGHTPLAKPLVANVGMLRVSLRKDGREIASRQVELAAGDRPTLALDAAPSSAPPVAMTPPLLAATPEPARAGRSPWAATAWVTAGALGVGTAVTGVLALRAASDLDHERHADDASRASLDSAQHRTRTLALVTDILGGATVLTAGFALYATLSTPRTRPLESGIVVRVGAGSVSVGGAF
jgi:hypothetical protein